MAAEDGGGTALGWNGGTGGEPGAGSCLATLMAGSVSKVVSKQAKEVNIAQLVVLYSVDTEMTATSTRFFQWDRKHWGC